MIVVAVLPALDEEAALPGVLRGLPRDLLAHVVVVDNGSTDRTAEVARAAGAEVVHEPRRGYGRACLAGIAAARRAGAEVVVFLDADGADDPADIPRVLSPLADRRADFVVGSRTRGGAAPRALTPQARLGNALATTLIRWLWGVRFSDLGPLRAIRLDTLDRLAVSDPTFGWTVEMQVRAAKRGVRCVEIPVSYRPRIGRSKISGTLVGSVRAGLGILGTIAREAGRR